MMKVLLRDKTSGLYYLTADKWTGDRALAFDFQTGERALDAGLRLTSSEDLEMVYAFRDPQHDFAVSIRSEAVI